MRWSFLTFCLLLASEIAPQPLVLAHRGSSLVAPENTLPAFVQASSFNAGIELDLAITRDGEIVALHDKMLNRTTNGHGPLKNKTYSEIARLDAGSWFSKKYRGIRIPTLDQVFTYTENNTPLAIDLKYYDMQRFNQLSKIIKGRRAEERVILFNMHYKHARLMRKALPRATICARVKDNRRHRLNFLLKKSHINCIWATEVKSRWITRKLVQRVHANEKIIIAGGLSLRQKSSWNRLLRTGVDGICTKHPRQLKQVIDRSQWLLAMKQKRRPPAD